MQALGVLMATLMVSDIQLFVKFELFIILYDAMAVHTVFANV